MMRLRWRMGKGARLLLCALGCYIVLPMLFQTRLAKTDTRDTQAANDRGRALKEWDASIHKPHTVVKGLPVQPQDLCVGEVAWQEFSFKPVWHKAHAFSAFWDKRYNDFDNAYNYTWIRIMTILPSGRRLKRNPASCLFHVNGEYVTSELQYYEMCENHNKDYGGYILSCKVPAEVTQRPCSVLVQEGSDPNPDKSTRIPVYSTEPRSMKQRHGICVSPLFGNVDPKKLVEFIELSRLLGAERITFFDANVNDELKGILKYYNDQGLVHSVPWLLDGGVKSRIWYFGQLVALQDCLYRNMGSVEVIAVNDIDEFIVPQYLTNWYEWLNETAQPLHAGYSFKSAFYPPQHGRGNHFLVTLQNDMRTTQVNRVRNKVMLFPDRVFEVGIHHISKPVLASLQVVPVRDTSVLLHHYRSCSTSYMQDCKDIVQDNRIKEVFSPRLEEVVLRALQDLKIDL